MTKPYEQVSVLAERYGDKRYNSPDDIALDSKGRIYFTDPRYGSRYLLRTYPNSLTVSILERN